MFLASTAGIYARDDLSGDGVTPLESAPDQKKEKILRPPDVYVEKIAEYFNAKANDVIRLWYKGYGRNELIKLLLIMQKSHRKVRELESMRDKNEELSKIAAKYNLDYEAILAEAIEVRRTIDRRISDRVPKASLQISTGTEKNHD
jgi:hypothetical protein